jgi:glycosyltransferase involved in cell wall biosynthesis
LLALRGALKQAGAETVMSLIGVTNILTVLAGFGLGLRIVISERNDPARQSLGRAWDRLRRLLYRRADLVTANSQAAIAALAAYVPRQKLVYLPNPLPPQAAEASLSAACVVLNVGRLTAQKAQDVLIDAFAMVAPGHPQWRLELLGEGEAEAALRNQAEALGVSPRVRFEGLSKDPWGHYREAGIFVLASRFEGTPNALLEAMSCGLPVIVSDAPGGMRDLVEHDVTGLVVPADDVTALADALRLLMTDGERRRRLGEAARKYLSEAGLDRAMATWEHVLGLAAG